MVETAQAESMGGQPWDGVVTRALQSSGIHGIVLLGGGCRPVAIPFGLPALMSALLHFVARQAPRRLCVYSYDLAHVGCLLELRGARELTELPAQLTLLAEELGVRLDLQSRDACSTVRLTLPSLPHGN